MILLSVSQGVKDISNEVEIFNEGIVNSLFAIELMIFIEKEFNIKVNVEDLDLDHFKSINSISEFIEAKKNF
ncbi:phosphopantetheine-binding protein [Haloimpatiens massiliensis]|uniref:phosphopantetheine-binding protein n=1 Tax=Haloimpatiens massiliensis TaxID=1658110 RepID=UPI000C823F2D